MPELFRDVRTLHHIKIYTSEDIQEMPQTRSTAFPRYKRKTARHTMTHPSYPSSVRPFVHPYVRL